ncbi:MAG: hypothetical protein WBB18_11645 [Nodosilinea sp.]
MSDIVVSRLVAQITEQLQILSADDLCTVQDFVAYLAWKQQSADYPSEHEKLAEAWALRRIQELDDPDDSSKWITVAEAGEYTDEAELNSGSKTRGS